MAEWVCKLIVLYLTGRQKFNMQFALFLTEQTYPNLKAVICFLGLGFEFGERESREPQCKWGCQRKVKAAKSFQSWPRFGENPR